MKYKIKVSNRKITELIFPGLKSVKELNIPGSVYDKVIVPMFKINSYDVVFRFNTNSVHVGCKNIDLKTIKAMLAELKDGPLKVKSLYRVKTNRLLCDMSEVSEITDKFYIYKKNKAIPVEEIVVKERKVTLLKKGNGYYYGDYFAYKGSRVCLIKEKKWLISFLERIVEVFDFVENYK